MHCAPPVVPSSTPCTTSATRNPHHVSRGEHDRQLDVLVPAADALITLTSGAADEIEARWGRRPTVIPHPHVVDIDTMRAVAAARRARPQRSGFRVGVHIKSLRASMAPARVIEALVDAVAALPGATLQVDGHTDVLTEEGERHDATLTRMLRDREARGLLELRIHDFFSDDELWSYLSSLDVSVLPYRFGTHSGWLEACRDLGTAVVAPSCGYYRDQGPVCEYFHDEERFEAASLTAALARAHADPRPVAAGIPERLAERAAIEHAHDRLYRAVLA